MLPRGISTLMKLPSYLKRLVSEAADKDMIKPMSGISSMTMRPSPKVKEQGLREYFKSTRNVDIDEGLTDKILLNGSNYFSKLNYIVPSR